MNSAGTAMKANAVYMDSVQAKIGVLGADFESLSNTILDSDLLKFGIDVLDVLVKIVDYLAEIKVLLPGIVTIVTALNAVGNIKQLSASVDLFLTSLRGSSELTGSLTTSFLNLNKAQQQYILNSIASDTSATASTLRRVVAMQDLDLATQKEIASEWLRVLATQGVVGADAQAELATYGFADAQMVAKVATDQGTASNIAFGQSLKLMWASNPVGLILTVVSILATVLIPVLSKAIVTAKEAREAYKKEQSELDLISQQLQANKDKWEELTEAQKSGDYSEQRQNEIDDLKEINNQLEREYAWKKLIADDDKRKAVEKTTKKFNGTVYAYTDTSGAIPIQQYTDAAGRLTHAQQELSEIDRQIADIDEKLSTTTDPKQLRTYQKNLSLLQRQRDSVIAIVKSIINSYDDAKDYLDEATTNKYGSLIEQWRDVIFGNAGVTFADDVSSGVESATDTIVSSAKTITTVLKELGVEITAIYGKGGKVDLVNRPSVTITANNIDTVKGWGMSDAQIGNTMTVASQTYRDAKKAIVITPILPDGSLLTQAELDKYIDDVILKTARAGDGDYAKNDDKGLIMAVFGDETTWEDNLARSEEFANRVHEIHEAMLNAATPEEAERYRRALAALAPTDDEFSRLSTLRDDLKTLGEAFKDLSAEDSLGLTYTTLEKIADKFADVDGIDTYITRLAKAGKNADQVTDIFKELALAKLQNAVDSGVLANADEAVIDALLREVGASSSAAGALRALATAESIVSNTALNFTQQIAALRELAEEAGLTASTINAIFAGSDLTAMGTGDWDEISNMTPGELQEYRLRTTKNNLDAKLKSVLKMQLKDVVSPPGGGGGGGGSVEDYIVDIDKYRDAIRRLEAAQKEREDLEHEISRTESPQRQVLQNRQVIDTYEREQAALHDLNEARRETIFENIKRLEELGFVVEYNAELNDFWIVNLEHVNELQQDIRKSTEELIETTDDLNESNKDGSKNWWELNDSIADARKQINSLLKEIVDNASKAVDQMQSVYDTLHKAADEYASSGYVTIDTVQSLISLGTEYMQYLIDENGQLVINEERVKAAVKAKMEQLAVENALVYVEALSIAQAEGNTAELNRLLFATQETTKGTWGLVYATIAYLNLTEEERQAAYHNVDTMRALAEMASDNIGSELERMKDGVDSILKYVQEMLKAQSQAIIDSLNEQKQTYSEIIDRQKESLQLRKKEADYSKSVEKRLKDIAKLQARIDALSLDNSRSAQAERAKLLEQLAEQQEELADAQNDHAVEAQEKALDEMNDAYAKQKDKEIKAEEDKYSSTQKLYDAAIKYIEQHWSTLYDELRQWNYESGQYLESEIVTAWDNCLAAAERYGSYVAALNTIGSDLAAERSNSGIVGVTPKYDHSFTDADKKNSPIIASYVNQMKANSRAWRNTTDENTRRDLADDNQRIADTLNGSPYYLGITRDSSGYWIMEDGSILYDLDNPSRGVFHQGGIVGDSTLRQDELFATLQKGELVLTKQQQSVVAGMVDFMSIVKSRLSGELSRVRVPSLGASNYLDILSAAGEVGGETTVNFGDVYITGTDKDNIAKYREVNREFVNDVVKVLNLRR